MEKLKKYIHELMTDQRTGLFARLCKNDLFIFSLFYGGAVRFMDALYAWKVLPSYKAPKTVISVGNITVGGAGKTPLVIAVVNLLRTAGLRPAVLSRGYMAGNNTEGDEPTMMTELLPGTPVLVGADRVRNIRAALEQGDLPAGQAGVDVFVCDDAFQHRPLQRDLDIVAVDALNPFGNGRLLPRGILREPISALGRAQIIVITRADRVSFGVADLRRQLSQINPSALIVESTHQPLGLADVHTQVFAGWDAVRGKKVAAFCAIANPEAFGHSLTQAGAEVVKRFDFMDHHVYTIMEIEEMCEFCSANGIDTMVTTHKDAVKIQTLKDAWQGIKILRLNIGLTITHGNEQFIERVLSICRP